MAVHRHTFSGQFLGFLIILPTFTAAACTNGSDEEDEMPITLERGDTIPTGTTVRIDVGGTYQPTDGATSLTTRCTGRVTVSFETTPDSLQTDTCESPDGSSSQANNVSGGSRVMYELGPAVFANGSLS